MKVNLGDILYTKYDFCTMHPYYLYYIRCFDNKLKVNTYIRLSSSGATSRIGDNQTFRMVFGDNFKNVISKITIDKRKILKNKNKREKDEVIDYNQSIIKTNEGFFIVLIDTNHCETSTIYLLDLKTYKMQRGIVNTKNCKEKESELKMIEKLIFQLYQELNCTQLDKSKATILLKHEYDLYLIDELGRYRLANGVLK